MDQQKIGEFISLRRKELDLTQAELGERLGVGQRTVSRWETGRNMPDISLLQPLSDLLEISVTELLNGERNEGDTLPNERASAAISGLLELWRKRQRPKSVLRAAVTLLITLACMFALYSAEFDVQIATTADLEQAIDRYHFNREFASQVVEWTSAGDRLAVLYLQAGYDNAGGLALLEKGIFGKYRILNARDYNESLYKLRTFSSHGQTQLLLFSVGTLPQGVTYAVQSVDGSAGEPLLQGPVYQGPFLLHIETRDPPDAYNGWDSVHYFAPTGEELNHVDLIRATGQDLSASSSGYDSAEVRAIYWMEAGVLLLGLLFVWIFLRH